MAKLWQKQKNSVRRLVIPVATLVVSVALSGCLGWYPQLSTDDGSQVTGISCPTTEVCFSVGSTAGGQTVLERSTDGGALWTPLSDIVAGETLTAISCPDVDHCIAVGGLGDALATTDGGQTWERLSLPATVYDLSSVWCLDDQHCWVSSSVGSPSFAPTNATVDVTADAGTTWASSSTFVAPRTDGYGLGLSSITCPTLRECVGVGNYWFDVDVGSPFPEPSYEAVIATSDDGGATWQTQDAGAARLRGISCLSPGACVSLTDGSVVKLVTTDGGSTWSASLVPVPSDHSGDYLAAVSCSDSLHCVAVGDSADQQGVKDGVPDAFTNTPVIATSDGADSWSVQYTDTSDPYPPDLNLKAVSCPTDAECWAAGEQLPNSQSRGATGSVVIHTFNGGAAWPSVSSVSPSQGTDGGGNQVTISGAGFEYGSPSVQFGSTPALDITVISGSEMTVTVPPSAVGGEGSTVDVTVSDPLGTSPVNPGDQYTYQSPNGPLDEIASAVAAEAGQ